MTHLWIALGALLTIGVETLFFWCFGYRDKKFIVACIIANLLTNYALNYVLFYRPDGLDYQATLWIGEALVVALEAGVYLVLRKKQYELIPLTLAANITSFLIGIGYYALLHFAGF